MNNGGNAAELGAETMAKRKQKADYPPDIWLAGATRAAIAAGTPVKKAYADAVALWQEQGRMLKVDPFHGQRFRLVNRCDGQGDQTPPH